ncbi:hypothetical protein FKW77_001085 [Venturia effusa]|uniref:Uncharacterized protein n=1 Tax=Venturia effusa TaxID=50376 RepID=A0A517LKU2_9PEZI|nr:hypothetical protein FKW77_001085 [Venturia effusa]
MASNLGLSVPFQNFLPITGTAALPFTLYFLTLSGRIVYHRVKTHQYMGENIGAKNQSKEAAEKEVIRQEDDPLNLAIRAHQNFLDNVPLAFILLTTAELNGGSRKALTYIMSALFAFRLAHVEYGLYGPDNASPGRPFGYFGTNGVLAGLAGYTAWLVRGYWGFD